MAIQFEPQVITDSFQEYLNRDPSPEELARFTTTTEYQLGLYLRMQPEYIQSDVFINRYAQIQMMAIDKLGYYLTPEQVTAWARQELDDDQIKWSIINSPEYKTMFKYKPGFMPEDEYRRRYETWAINRDAATRAYKDYLGRDLSEEETAKIFIGGPGSEALRSEWENVVKPRLQAEIENRKSATMLQSGVKHTGFGASQPLLQGQVQAGQGKGGSAQRRAEPDELEGFKQARGMPMIKTYR